MLSTSERQTNEQTRTYDRASSVVFLKTDAPFGGLSNMAGGFPLHVQGTRIYTSEALYQACRFPHLPEVQRLIIGQASPMTAKMKSKPHRKDSRPDWDRVRIKAMRWCLRVKLAQNWAKFSELLLRTDDRPIVEESRRDDFWGAKPVNDRTLVGMNVLGRLLMELREAVRSHGREAFSTVEPPDISEFLLLGRPIMRIGESDLMTANRKAARDAVSGGPRRTQDDIPQQSLFDTLSATKAPSSVRSTQSVPEGAHSGEIKPYSAVKDSGVPWLGQVPEHWQISPAFAAYRPRQVKNTKSVESTVLSLSYGRIIIKAPERLRGLVPESFDTYQIVEPGNIIVRTTDLQNDRTSLRVGHARHRGIITAAYMCLETKPIVLNEFGYQYLNAYDLLKIIYGFGSGLRQNLDFSDIKRMPVLVPPRDEQTAIVRFLDHVDRRIRRYIRAKQKLIKLLEEQKQAIIQRAVTRSLDPNVRLKPSDVEWLADVPEHWEVRRAKTICSAIVDCKNRTPVAIAGGNYLVVRTTCVRGGRFDVAGSYETDEYNFRIWTARGAPRRGDVFFTREAPAGEACLVPDRSDLCMGQRMMYLRPNPHLLDPEFLLLSIYGPLTRRYVELATNGSTVGHLRLGQVYALPVLWCPLEEQRAIVRYVQGATKQLERMQRGAERQILLFREYRTRLIADVVTGKLDVRDAAARLPVEPDDQDSVDEMEALADAEAEVDESEIDADAEPAPALNE